MWGRLAQEACAGACSPWAGLRTAKRRCRLGWAAWASHSGMLVGCCLVSYSKAPLACPPTPRPAPSVCSPTQPPGAGAAAAAAAARRAVRPSRCGDLRGSQARAQPRGVTRAAGRLGRERTNQGVVLPCAIYALSVHFPLHCCDKTLRRPRLLASLCSAPSWTWWRAALPMARCCCTASPAGSLCGRWRCRWACRPRCCAWCPRRVRCSWVLVPSWRRQVAGRVWLV